MENATITLNWDSTNGITANLSTISGSPNSVVNVTWASGTNVSAIGNITTPIAASGATLNTPTQNSNGVWGFADQLGTTSVTYAYTVTLTNTSGTTITSDPQIINNPT